MFIRRLMKYSTSQSFRLRVMLCALVVALLCAVAIYRSVGVRASDPANGTLTLANTESNPLTYTAGPFFVSNQTALTGGIIDGVGQQCNPTFQCDDYTLIVNVPDGLLDTKEIRVIVAWGKPVSDFDIYALKNNKIFTSAGSSMNPETITLPAVSGVYTIRSVPFTVSGDTITTTMFIRDKAPTTQPSTETPPSYRNYQSPAGMGDGAGEPSIGVNWKTGKVMFEAKLQTLRVTFDDTVSPATATWASVSPNTNHVSLDPILFTDSRTGRTIVSQLFGTTSLSSYSDDDGATWIPNEGGGMTSGIDHQTVGGGPFHDPLTRNQSGPVYPNAVYYCSQDLYTAFCARSDNGGLTYGPTIPIYTSIDTCSGIHGHVKVAFNGIVYVPNHTCGLNQGVAISEDNGINWRVSKVVDADTTNAIGDSTPSDWDPSIGTGKKGTTVYFGYKNGDGHPHVAVSYDHATSWSYDQDVGVASHIRNIAFPTVVAGDEDRAAFAFLGSDLPGDDPAAVWYLYVSTTYDRGRTWVTTNITPNDPVQRGTICSGGISCSGNDRNLLDFIDSTVDSQGRVLVGYADGCITPQCIGGGPNDFKSKATIARQTGGKRLFADFDSASTLTSGASLLAETTNTSDRMLARIFNAPGARSARSNAARINRSPSLTTARKGS
ncbi:MAG: hypothetical protein AUG51_01605 [Acidobacteria bacterium 13_1_20CM_3_53_8]|nr:MAG: hypothetical protein AUG51_01605 [Acidobacteria bacterium 13_1_20CM_3_53_8]